LSITASSRSARVAQGHRAAGGGRGHEEGAGLDAVGHDRMARSGQPLDPLHRDDVGAGAANARAHRVEAVRQVDDLGLSCGVLEHRHAVREAGGHHQVLGAGHGHEVHDVPRSLQASRARFDVALLDANLGPESLQTLHVLVDRPQPDGAAARERHARVPAAGEERPEHQDRGPHGLHELVRRERLVKARSVQVHARTVDRRLDAHLLEQPQHRADVVKPRNVGQPQRLDGEQRGAHDRQRRILRAGDAHRTAQGRAADDQELVHSYRRGA
jgi:hypothetical protein